ncbi:hypothetical protein TWF281_006288 [Arthrobotrys megalospora]
MSGAEFVAVAAVASSIIAIVDGITKVLQAASDARGLPKVFRQAQSKLEIISEILDATTSAFDKNKASGIESTVQKTVDNCQATWQKLKELFDKVIPEEEASRIERYRKAAKTLGKGSKVELLMKDLMENVKLLATLKIMTQRGVEEVIQANPKKEELEEDIAEVERWEPSLPDHIFDEGGRIMQVSGSGHNAIQGENAQQFVSRDNAQNIGAIHGGYHSHVSYNNFSERDMAVVDAIDQACLDFLQCPDTWAVKNHLQETKDGLVVESIDWMFKHQQYTSWRNEDKVSLLLIRGGAGKGKTMLSIGIIEELPPNAVVTYFFCQNANCELNTIDAIIKGLILRLAKQRQETARVLRSHWDAKTESLINPKNSPLWRLLWDIFLQMLDQCECSRVYAIVDALDECQDDMEDFLKLLARTGLGQPSKIKWLLTSRPSDTTHRELLTRSNQALVSLEDNPRLVAAGVAVYIAERVTELSNRNSYSSELRKELEDQLIQKAEGTYMWVSLVCKELENVPRHDALATIQGLPSGLYPLYNRALNQLSSGEPALAKGCMRLLKAMMLAYRPLNAVELDSVSGLSDEPATLDRLIDRCSSFVKKQERTGIVEFIHQSARDYLAESHGQDILDADGHYGHGEIALSCLSYLSQRLKVNLLGLLRPNSTRESIESNPLVASMGYAATLWAQHLESASETALIQDVINEQGELSVFLRTKLLQWLECLIWLDKLPHATKVLKVLAGVVENNPFLSALVKDAASFLRQHYQMIKIWPLQLYSSATAFSPGTSAVRRENLNNLPNWLKGIPQAEEAGMDPIQSFSGLSIPVDAIAFSRDGKKIASLLASVQSMSYIIRQRLYVRVIDITIELWDAETGDRNKTIKCGCYTFREVLGSSIAFSPDGKQIISGLGNTVDLWDITAGNARRLLEDSSGPVTAVTFSPCGKRIACGLGNVIKVCDAITGSLQRTFANHSSVGAVAFSPDGKRIVSASAFHYTLRLWDATNGELQWEHELQTWSNNRVSAVVFSSNGKQITLASWGDLKLCDAGTGGIQGELKGHLEPTHIVAFSSDGSQIASGYPNGVIKLWNIIKFPRGREHGGHLRSIQTLAFSPDGKQVASGHLSTLKIWDSATGNLSKAIKIIGPNNLMSLAFSSDGKQITAGPFGEIKVWNTVTGKSLKQFPHLHGGATAIAFSPDDKQIAAGDWDRAINLWDAATGELQRKLKGHSARVVAVAFSPDGKQIMSAAREPTIKLWNARNGGLDGKFVEDWDSEGTNPIFTIAFSPDGKQIASGSKYGIKLWSCTEASGIVRLAGVTTRVTAIGMGQIPSKEIIRYLKFSKDSKNLVTNLGHISIGDIPANKQNIRLGKFFAKKGDNHLESLEDLGVRLGWIYYGELRVLRLPLQIRSIIRQTIIGGDTVAIGLEDGRVLIFNFDRDHLRLILENS